MEEFQKLLFVNADILTPFEQIINGAVLVEGKTIINVFPETPELDRFRIVDLDGFYLVPGFIDLQLNGGFGFDFTQTPDAIWKTAEQLPQFGVTSFLPTIITSPFATIRQAQQVINSNVPKGFTGSWPLGLHIEGPFLNHAKKGAHNPNFLRLPDLHLVKDWSRETGVKLVTLAPELSGALNLVDFLLEQDIVVSVGHSMANYVDARKAIASGIRYATHIFNAMPIMHHREPGLIGALLEDPRVTVGIIPDGIHVHPAIISLVLHLVGGGRLNLVTDAMAAMGNPPGLYSLGDFDVIVDATSARLEDGTLAGSIITLDSAFRNLMVFTNCGMGEALQTITSTPAHLIGENQKGQIAPGFDADLVILSKDLKVIATLVNGEVVFQSGNEIQW